MKKLLSILVFCLFFFSASFTVFAQEVKKFDDLFLSYNLKIEEYQKAHEEYVLKRAQYLSFRTLTSQEEAYAATRSMLFLRDDVVILYLQSLKARLNEAVGTKEEKKNELNLLIDLEVDWFTDHKENLPSAGDLDDLVSDSDEAKVRYNGLQNLIFQVLSHISSAKVYDFDNRFDATFAELRDKIERIRNDEREEFMLPSEKLQIIDRWVFDAQSRVTRSEEKLVSVEESIVTASKKKGTSPSAFFGEYNKVIEGLMEVQLFLKESASFLKEVIREIKVKK